MPVLSLYNSLTRQKEAFTPIDPGHVRLYACGPTVYSFAHIGNARMAVVFDLLSRVMKTLYPKVTYVSNITDIDDRIMDAARQSGESIDAVSRKYESIYNLDMATLGVAMPDVQPRATEHIAEMIALIENLIARKHAYAKNGEVLFHVPSFKAYGGLSGRSRDEQIAGARVDVAAHKEDPADFILWKPSSDDQPGWDSPWGRGRPGWHIECSAMAEKHLGLPFDIHGGGADLKFPHHENEIAQSCCGSAHANETDLASFAKMWVHNGFVTVAGEKMSKSLGNFTTVHDLLDKDIKGETIRLALLAAHYRQPLDWNDDGINQAEKLLLRIYKVRHEHNIATDLDGVIDADVQAALCDDLNTPQANAALIRLVDAAKDDKGLHGTLIATLKLLNIGLGDPAEFLGLNREIDQDLAGKVEALIIARQDARKAKDFAKADQIRDEIANLGVVLEDTAQGPKWRLA
jgi:cysteinyl-tRNA synthetase